MKYLLATLLTASFLFAWDKSFGETIITDNLLSNSTFTGGNTGWTNHGTQQQHHTNYGNECNPNTAGNFNTTCGIEKGSFAGVDEGGISQTIKLSEKTNMTQAEINNGFTSTMSNDIWFWHGQDSVTMTQELTDSSGTTTTQNRVVTGSHNYYQTYTDTATIGTNTSTDFDIKVKLDIDDSSNLTNYHAGPDIDNVELKVSYTYINPIDEDAQDIIDDINEDIDDVIDDIDWEEEEYTWDDTWYEEEYTWYEEDYTWEDDFYFEEEYDTSWNEEIVFEEFEVFEEFDDTVNFEEMPIMEEVFFENEYIEPPMMTEELFTEEFEEDFTEFIEETGMEEEFMEFLEEEGITAEEFFEEITEEEFTNDELTTESFEEFEEEFAEESTVEESPSEIVANEEETMEEVVESEPELEEEQEVAQNEQAEEPSQQEEEESVQAEEEESSSEGTDDSEVQSEEGGEQEDIQSEERDELDTDKRIATDVAKIESKLKKNLKKIAKQIAQTTKVNTQNLSKEDLFFKNNNSLDVYKKIAFYKAKDIYENANMGLFLQLDLSPYTGDIYLGTNLNDYTLNDPVEVHRVKLMNIEKVKRKLLTELEVLKQQ